jgi:hypothetical protein
MKEILSPINLTLAQKQKKKWQQRDRDYEEVT